MNEMCTMYMYMDGSVANVDISTFPMAHLMQTL